MTILSGILLIALGIEVVWYARLILKASRYRAQIDAEYKAHVARCDKTYQILTEECQRTLARKVALLKAFCADPWNPKWSDGAFLDDDPKLH